MEKLTLAVLALAFGIASADAQTPMLVDPSTGKYLGTLNANRYDPNSTANPYGQYGSPYSPDSINNQYGKYGSPYSPNSVNNPYASGDRVPAIVGTCPGGGRC